MKKSILEKIIGAFTSAFNRRYEHSKIHNKVNRLQRRKIKRNGKKIRSSRYHGVIRYITSKLAIKRQGDLHHLTARVYKRLFKGVCGARTWADWEKGRNMNGEHVMLQKVLANRYRRGPMYAERAAKAAGVRAERRHSAVIFQGSVAAAA